MLKNLITDLLQVNDLSSVSQPEMAIQVKVCPMQCRQIWLKLAVIVLSSLIVASPGKAQTPTNPSAPEVPPQDVIPPTTPPIPESPSPSELPPEEFLLPEPSLPEAPPSTEETLTVTEFRFTGNTALSDEELAQTVAGLTNQPLPSSQTASGSLGCGLTLCPTRIPNFWSDCFDS